ncbi:ABC transporter substrate-binding protein [Corynebacterium sp. AOP36-E1-14]|uniref:ABC transporter substrate-binding protein n=1 Tax=unclassified Corynebacterium TaxID=2624378 RepID=UPI002653535E|nr:ABC transporter substrate-binding protein [Corynebacterium sp.]
MKRPATTAPTVTTTLVLASSLLLASCGSGGNGGNGSTDAAGDAAISVENCGDTVTLDGPPENVTLLKPAAVTTLADLGVLDRVANRAGQYPEEYFDDATNRALADIPSITDKTDESGHLQISREEVVAAAPDLVLGETDTVNRQTLASSDIPLIEEPAFCDAIDGPVTWDDVWDQVGLYGTVFDRQDAAASTVDDLRARLAAVEEEAASHAAAGRSVAVLYPTVGGGVTYAYGAGSMAAPIVASTGASNVYGDQADRVFEVTAEDIVERNPDVILALHSDGGEDQVLDAVNQIPGIDRTTAGRSQNILPMLLNYAEPPTPLAVDGLEKLTTYLQENP